jgi:hypothetical protein
MKLGYHKMALENIQLAHENDHPRSKMDQLLEREQWHQREFIPEKQGCQAEVLDANVASQQKVSLL